MIKGNIKSFRRGPAKQQKPKPQKQKGSNKKRNRQKKPKKANNLTKNSSNYGGPFRSGNKGSSRDYRCLEAEETISLIASPNSSAFNVLNVFNINPGNATTFPLLSQEAAVYETYKFDYLEFYTIPEVSAFATGGTTGQLAISVDFNAAHPQPASFTAAVDLKPNDANLPCKPTQIVLPPAKMHAGQNDAKYIRVGGLLGGNDIKTYDIGNLFVSCEGLNASVFNVCRLYCRYKVHLMTRVNIAGMGAPQNNQVTNLVDSKQAITTNTPYQPLLAAASSSALPVTNGLNVVNTAGSLVPPPGNYLLMCSCIIENSNGVLQSASMSVSENGIVQNQGGGATYNVTAAFEADFGGVFGTGVATLNSDQWISCNGTDAITLTLLSLFGSGNTLATTTVLLVAI